jgi:hypothetical protein
MLRRVILPALAIPLIACVSTPATTKIDRFDPSLRLAKQCKAEAKQVAGIWYVNVDRDPPDPPPDQPKIFASGAFDARIPVWVTFGNGLGQQLVTVSIGASEDGARVDSGSVSTGRMITEKIDFVDAPKKCEAFAAPPTAMRTSSPETLRGARL